MKSRNKDRRPGRRARTFVVSDVRVVDRHEKWVDVRVVSSLSSIHVDFCLDRTGVAADAAENLGVRMVKVYW